MTPTIPTEVKQSFCYVKFVRPFRLFPILSLERKQNVHTYILMGSIKTKATNKQTNKFKMLFQIRYLRSHVDSS